MATELKQKNPSLRAGSGELSFRRVYFEVDNTFLHETNHLSCSFLFVRGSRVFENTYFNYRRMNDTGNVLTSAYFVSIAE